MLEDYPTLRIDLEVEAKMKEQAILRLYEKYPQLFKNFSNEKSSL
jgi:hypothetical protein